MVNVMHGRVTGSEQPLCLSVCLYAGWGKRLAVLPTCDRLKVRIISASVKKIWYTILYSTLECFYMALLLLSPLPKYCCHVLMIWICDQMKCQEKWRFPPKLRSFRDCYGWLATLSGGVHGAGVITARWVRESNRVGAHIDLACRSRHRMSPPGSV